MSNGLFPLKDTDYLISNQTARNDAFTLLLEVTKYNSDYVSMLLDQLYIIYNNYNVYIFLLILFFFLSLFLLFYFFIFFFFFLLLLYRHYLHYQKGSSISILNQWFEILVPLRLVIVV